MLSYLFDHCRIGSLEILLLIKGVPDIDHCRIGSLEMHRWWWLHHGIRSLPHRQLRNDSELINDVTG